MAQMNYFAPLILFFFVLISCQPKQNNNVANTENDEVKKRPNIVFIMSDDHGYQAISAYSDRLIQTPNIDRLANEGMLFTNACVTNSICAPSRATILTGKHCHIHGKIDNHFPFDTTTVTFPQLLQQSGYQTGMFGKLHFGNNPKGIDDYKILPGQGHYYNPEFITPNGPEIVEGYVTDIITDMSIDWLEKRDPDKPFLLMYLHKAPHREYLPAERHHKEYTKKHFVEPETLFDDYKNRGTAAKEAEMNLLKHMFWAGDSKLRPEVMEELGIKPTGIWDTMRYSLTTKRMTDAQKKAWDESYDVINEDFKKNYSSMNEKELMKWRYQRYMQDYLACIAAVDENVGRMLTYLDDNNLTENTIVVYTSDQGFFLGEHGWYNKRFIYDESFKTPLLIRWPSVIKPKSKCDEMVQNLDFAQTLLEAAGIDALDDMQGESLVPLLKGENEKWDRKEVYYHYYEYPAVIMVKRHYGIVTKEYKLAHFYYDIDEWELYDRKKDPQEMNNVYNDPAYANVVTDLTKRLKNLREKYKDSKELDKKYIDMYKDLIEQRMSESINNQK